MTTSKGSLIIIILMLGIAWIYDHYQAKKQKEGERKNVQEKHS